MSGVLKVGEREIAVDKDGFLVDLTDWDESVGAALAEAEGLAFGEEQREIVLVLREFYRQFQLSPATRPLIKYVTQRLGPDKGNSAHLNRLFKGTPAKLAAKLAGLPKPSNCI